MTSAALDVSLNPMDAAARSGDNVASMPAAGVFGKPGLGYHTAAEIVLLLEQLAAPG